MTDVYCSLQEANTARQKEWDVDNQITLAYRGNELAGEVGEACNVIKKLERERMGIRGSRDTVEHLAEELADIEICNGLIAMQAGIDLDAAVVAKFNATSEKMGLKTRMALRDHAPSAMTPTGDDDEENDLVWRLLHPLWSHGPSGPAHLDRDAAVSDMRQAAAEIQRLSAPTRSAATSAALTDTREALSADLEKVQCELDAAALRVTDLEAALKFYRDAWQYKPGPTGLGLEWSPKEELLDDCGNRAKDALARNDRGGDRDA